MKQLGIITFNRALNYGAILQAYALKSVCESLGYEVHIVDYNRGDDLGPHPVKAFAHSAKKKREFVRFLKGSLSFSGDRKRWNAFKSFRTDYLSESLSCKSIADIEALGYSVYIAGSDQIWNYNITGGSFNPVYFGRFSKNAVTVVYGASAQDTPFPLNMELELQKQLSKTHAPIGIREKKLADYVGTVTGIKYPVVLDPTLLAGRAVLEKVQKDLNVKDSYILIHQIDRNPASDISIRSLEKRFGCRVLSMTVPKVGSSHGKMGEVGPGEYLSLLDKAKFVVTNSFHGVALSLLWHKQFYVYDNGGVMTRIDDLLNLLGLADRKVKLASDIDLNRIIDYDRVDLILAEKRRESEEFLKKALQGNRQISHYEQTEAKNPNQLENRNKEDCSGCSACVEICPAAAITMEPDKEGFLYPVIEEKSCIHCGLCDSFCAFRPVKRRGSDNLPEAYGVKHRETQTRLTSRSGGAFVAFSDVVLQKKGVVYGAAFEDDGSVRHVRAECSEERNRMKGAKYVQSDLTGVLKQVLDDLSCGREVFFSGTPCQVAGLKAIIDKKGVKGDLLYTCDLVCHGAPSAQIWRDYIDYIQKKYQTRIVQADFRDKTFGWDTHCEAFWLDNGKKIVSRDYTDLFYEHVLFRPSCHNCYYANINRVGDLTLGDFWGIEKNDPAFDDNKGVSLVLINTAKGSELFEKASAALDYIKCDIRNCLQPTLVKPSHPSPRREMFWESYQTKGFEATLKQFVKPVSLTAQMKRSTKQIMYRLKLRPHP